MYKSYLNKSLKYSVAIITIVFSLAGLVSCADKRLPALKLATTVWVGYEPLYLARDKQFIDEEEIKLIEMLSATQVMNAFRNKTIDMAALTMDEVLILAQENFEPVVLLVLDSSNGGDSVIAQDKYNSFKDLKSKKIGYENTAVGAYLLSRVLDINNMTSDEVNLVSMNVNETEAALKNNKVDAVVTFEPAKSRLIESGYKEVFSSREIPNEIIDVLVIRKDLIENNQKSIKSLVDAWFMALDYYENNRQESMTVMNHRLNLPEQRLSVAFDGIVFPDRLENINFFENINDESVLTKVAVRVSKEMFKNKLLSKSVDGFDLHESSFLRD